MAGGRSARKEGAGLPRMRRDNGARSADRLGADILIVFGDMGIGHVTQCKAHPRVLAFAWACS